jgi:hypothetical protein
MSTATVDYDALAKQAGAVSSQPATVDYDALAKQSGAISSEAPEQQQAAQPEPQNDYLTKAEDFIHGAAGGALKNIPFVGKYLGGNYSQSGVVNPDVEQMGEGAGRMYEQGLEMAATGGPLKAGATALAERLPFAAKYTAPLLRIGAEALNTGGSAALHGQPVGLAALLGAGGATVSEAGQALAPGLVERALGMRGKDLRYSKTPGSAVLEETSGIRPSTIAEQAGEQSQHLTRTVESMAKASNAPTSTQPAASIVLDEMIKAADENSATRYGQLEKVLNQLTTDFQTGKPIPSQMSAEQILKMKRGIGDLISSWSVEEKKGVMPVVAQVYHALDKELDQAVPASAGLNQRISSLITARQAAERTAARPSGVMGQFISHSTGAGLGSLLGYEAGGTKGAAQGALVGAIAGPVLRTPAARIAIARLVKSGMSEVMARMLVSQLGTQSDQGGQ